MRYELLYTKEAWSDLQELGIQEARRVAAKLKYFIAQPNPFTYSKPLKGNYKGLFRFRVGDFRAIFSKNARGTITLVSIIRVQHRKDVYE